jgi:dipeptidyl aminopeptidase/acylaminoacyl peptidase
MRMRAAILAALLLSASSLLESAAAQKPLLTLDEAFNYVQIQSVQLSPDGSAVVIGTRRPDWESGRFERTLWLYRNHALKRLTTSGKDHSPVWSPDGRWIAFLSDRPASGGAKASVSEQAYLISLTDGEAFEVTYEANPIDAVAWAPDSESLYFAVKPARPEEETREHKKRWHDVEVFREDDRGDVIRRLPLATAIATSQQSTPPKMDVTPGAMLIATLSESVDDLAASPDGTQLAVATASTSGRMESIADNELWLVTVDGGALHQLTHNQGNERDLAWSRDGKRILFAVHGGSIEGSYEDVQGRIYSIDPLTSHVERLGSNFEGSLDGPVLLEGGSVATSATVGTEVQVFTEGIGRQFVQCDGKPGSYSMLSAAAHSSKVAFVYSAQQSPPEVYVADSAKSLRDASPITHFNQLFAERELPKGRPYQWTADDGTKVEGWLLYPPGKFNGKHLRMLTLIHGGPASADGNHFRADWYDWAVIAASRGWLVFRPNYRGSTGYGDTFMRQISPHLVSRPAQDIMEGVDALVHDGIADPAHLAVGGYSYGGYLTNWLITQTTRFEAAVTGAGAVEHVANWGNDDLTFDDAWYLGGAPWEAEKNYNDEAAVWQMNKVRTPTQMVVGGSDVRVAQLESYLMERALHTLRVPNRLLILPDEGHMLGTNPWHGKIKVTEELNWLERYDAR